MNSVNEEQNQEAQTELPAIAEQQAILKTPEEYKSALQDNSKRNDTDFGDVGELLENIVLTALQRKATDIHIEPTENDVLIRFRIDGLLTDILLIDNSYEDKLISEIKLLSGLSATEPNLSLQGSCTFKFPDQEKLETHISFLPTFRGEKIVIHLLTRDPKLLTLEQLGISDVSLEKIKKNISKSDGMILAVGPTGSGTTTTLYAMLQMVNSREKNITTIEDPVEFNMTGVNHIQVNPQADINFAKGLRLILKQDPDIIMVGELQDTETARIAINAAMTGQLILSTIHTKDTITAISHLIDMGVEPYLVAATVNLIIAQRLARILCQDCKKEYTVTQVDVEDLLNTRPDVANEIKPGDKLFNHVGCDKCGNTGYLGRVGLYEILALNKEIRGIINSKDYNTDKLYAETEKMHLVTLLQDGIIKLRNGLIDIAELIRVTALNE